MCDISFKCDGESSPTWDVSPLPECAFTMSAVGTTQKHATFCGTLGQEISWFSHGAEVLTSCLIGLANSFASVGMAKQHPAKLNCKRDLCFQMNLSAESC